MAIVYFQGIPVLRAASVVWNQLEADYNTLDKTFVLTHSPQNVSDLLLLLLKVLF